ncbi:MAG: hypothetical protein GEU89_12910 [Kiloniellaceae bacterium]|nr:hypothetical protein [Kiloniellaceae bacterium]
MLKLRSLLIGVCLMVPVAFPGSASAFCSKPTVPHCASDGSLADAYVPLDRCRRQVADHLEDVERYTTCLRELIKEISEEAEVYEELIRNSSEDPPS